MSLRPWAVLAMCGLLAGCTAAPAPTPEPEPSFPANYVPLETTPTPTPTPSPTAPPGMVFSKDGKRLLRLIPADPKRSFKCRKPKPAEARLVSWISEGGPMASRPFLAVDAGGGWAAVGYWSNSDIVGPESAFVITNGEFINVTGDSFEGRYDYRRAGVAIEDAGRAIAAVVRCVNR